MPVKKEDPLEGFRARTDEDDLNEQVVRGIRGLSEAGIDYQAISDVIQSDDLVAALNDDKPLAKLVDHAAKIIKENSWEWSMANNHDDVKDLHTETRAARIVISWIESIVQTGEVAKQLISEEEVEENE